ncbi:MAG: hypothetical protein II364_00165 [Bacteroidales bacterium]|nr:hypothetical protein [Bacteroidales bacterium]
MGIAEEVAQMSHMCEIGRSPRVKRRVSAQKTPCGAKTHHLRQKPVIMKRLPRGKTGAAYTIPNTFYSQEGGMSSIMKQNYEKKTVIFDDKPKPAL